MESRRNQSGSKSDGKTDDGKTHGKTDDEQELTGVVPRLDRWVHALGLVERYDSLADFARALAVGDVGPQWATAGDDSPKTAGQLLLCAVQPLKWRDLQVLSDATCSSIALDERDGLLLVYCRVYVRRSAELYDCLLGMIRGLGTGAAECKKGTEDVVRRAFSVPVGRQRKKDAHAPVVFNAGQERFKMSVRSAVADGGPTEQRALYDCSPGAPDPGLASDPFFKNLQDIHRDRPHTLRSVQKGIWKHLTGEVHKLLGLLVTGKGSLARMLRTSKKYQRIFQVSWIAICTPYRKYVPPSEFGPMQSPCRLSSLLDGK